MKIMHIINGEFYSGAERVQDLLASGLAKKGVECSFVTLKSGRFAGARRSTTEMVHVPMRSRFDLSAAVSLARLVKDRRIDGIHSHTPRSALLAAMVRTLVKIPHFHHGHSPTDEDTENKWRNYVNSFAERRSFSGASALLAVSDRVSEYFVRSGMAAELIVRVDNGVPVQSETVHIRELGTSVRVGVSALFRPRKGIEVALAAVAKLVKEGLDVTFVGIGMFETESYRLDTERLVDQLGLRERVSWTGFTTDVYSQLRNLDVFCFPSLYGEGLPMAVIEAMSVGLPVVGSDIEGVRGPLANGGGLLFDVGSSSSLADALRRLAVSPDLRRELAANGVRRQRELFSDVSMADAVLKVYRAHIS